MEIRLHGPGEPPRPVAVTLRTPGNDFELAVGFLHAEGLVAGADDVASVAYCLGPEGEQEYNVVTVRHRNKIAEQITPRSFVANSSCGLCGKTTLDDIEQRCPSLAGRGPLVAESVVHALADLLAPRQTVFAATGGIHAAARVTPAGEVIALREDVGRHNALDKLVGHAVLERALPLTDEVIVVSGRLGFELVQKAALAGATVIAAIGAPSSLAIDAARRFGITAVAFVRADRANVYTHPERIAAGR